MSTAATHIPPETVVGRRKNHLGGFTHHGAGGFVGQKSARPSLKTKYPDFPKRNSPGEKPGGWDPKARISEMEIDGVSAEVLYPTLGLRLFAMEDAECQEACFQIANDWMIDYCKVTPGRLIGIPMISLYNIKNAIKELERCKRPAWSAA